MKRSEVIKELLSSYYFQNGKRTNRDIVKKANKIIKTFEEAEKIKME
jgi:hypothetical protein